MTGTAVGRADGPGGWRTSARRTWAAGRRQTEEHPEDQERRTMAVQGSGTGRQRPGINSSAAGPLERQAALRRRKETAGSDRREIPTAAPDPGGWPKQAGQNGAAREHRGFKGRGRLGPAGRKNAAIRQRSDNPDVLYGRDFEGETDGDRADRRGDGRGGHPRKDSYLVRQRELRSGKTIMIFDVTDFTDTITVKMFARTEQLDRAEGGRSRRETFIKLKGVTTIDKFDGELTMGSIVGIKKCGGFYRQADGQQPGEAGGAPLPYEDERHGRRVRGKGYHKAGQEVGNAGLGSDRPRLRPGLPGSPTMPWTRAIPLRSSTGWRDIWWTIPRSWWRTPRTRALDDTYVVFDIETTGFQP